MSKYNSTNIIELYGVNILEKIRRHEKISRKVGRFRAHLYFSLHCKHSNLTPKSLKIKCGATSNDPKCREIIKKAEKALLNNRITEIIAKKVALNRQKTKINNELTSIVEDDLYDEIIQKNNKREEKELQIASKRQIKKFNNLKYGKNPNPKHYRKIYCKLLSPPSNKPPCKILLKQISPRGLI